MEIDAKIAAGYFSSGKQVTEADLVKTGGRTLGRDRTLMDWMVESFIDSCP